MRKNIWIIVSGLVCFLACRSVQAPQLIGGNKDEHGCLTAAGYTWSELRRDCIRIFEDGVRVDDPSLQPSLTSYAVLRQTAAGWRFSVRLRSGTRYSTARGAFGWARPASCIGQETGGNFAKSEIKQNDFVWNELSIILQTTTCISSPCAARSSTIFPVPR